MYIAIIDIDQSELEHGTRQAITIQDDNYNNTLFESVEQIREVANGHILQDFQWWAFNLDTGEAEEV